MAGKAQQEDAAPSSQGENKAENKYEVPEWFQAIEKYGWDPDETECTILYRPGGAALCGHQRALERPL